MAREVVIAIDGRVTYARLDPHPAETQSEIMWFGAGRCAGP